MAAALARSRFAPVLAGLALVAALLALWQAAVVFGLVSHLVAPAPTMILASFPALITEEELLQRFLQTFAEAFAAAFLGSHSNSIHTLSVAYYIRNQSLLWLLSWPNEPLHARPFFRASSWMRMLCHFLIMKKPITQ